MFKLDGYAGGFIWDYIDQGLYNYDANGKKYIAYGGQFNAASETTFCGNGIVNADRTNTPEMQEVKACYKFVDFDITATSVSVKNNYNFTNLNEYTFKLTILKNGSKVSVTRFNLDAKPGETAIFDFKKPDFVGEIAIIAYNNSKKMRGSRYAKQGDGTVVSGYGLSRHCAGTGDGVQERNTAMKDMFCFQCQQTAHNTGCEGKAGVCGKKADTANYQDDIISSLIGLARAARDGKPTEATDALVEKALFTTITNVNFNNSTIKAIKTEVEQEKHRLSAGKYEDYPMDKGQFLTKSLIFKRLSKCVLCDDKEECQTFELQVRQKGSDDFPYSILLSVDNP